LAFNTGGSLSGSGDLGSSIFNCVALAMMTAAKTKSEVNSVDNECKVRNASMLAIYVIYSKHVHTSVATLRV